MLTFYPYHWCQVRAVIARELARVRDGSPTIEGWIDFYGEAGELTDAIRQGFGDAAALSIGARPGEVSWPDFACLAERYAEAPPDLRAEIREAFRRAEISPAVAAVPASAGYCSRAVKGDLHYYGDPPCYPPEAIMPATAIAAGIAGGLVLGFGFVMVRALLTASPRT